MMFLEKNKKYRNKNKFQNNKSYISEYQKRISHCNFSTAESHEIRKNIVKNYKKELQIMNFHMSV